MTRSSIDSGIPTLAVALVEHIKADDLRKLASLIGGRVPTRKADLADVIAKHLEGHGLRIVWQSLDELQKAAVAEVVYSPSTEFLADRFQAKYGRAPGWGSLDPYRRDESPTALRFFFYGSAGSGIMPDDLKKRLKAFVPPPVSPTVTSLAQLSAVYERPWERWSATTRKKEQGRESIPLTVRESERAAQREILSVLRLVDAGQVAVSDATRRPSAATMAAITAVLEGGDYYPCEPPKDRRYDANPGPIRAVAWPLIIQGGGLAQRSGSRRQLTRAGRKALAEPAAVTLRALWERWTDTAILDELARVDCVKGQTGKGKRGLTALAPRRKVIAAALAECPVQQWIAVDELRRYMRASGHDLVVSRNAWNLYIGELRYGSLGYAGSEGILETRYLLCLLFEYAATLGLLDVAFIPPAGARGDYHNLWGTDELPYFSRYDGLMFVRVTPLGAYCLGMGSDSTPAPAPGRGDAGAAGAAQPRDRGNRRGSRPGRPPRARRLRGARRGPRLAAGGAEAPRGHGERAFGGRDPRVSRHPQRGAAPRSVGRLLEDVAERGARVYDRGLARIVECAEPALAALIARDPRTRRHCRRVGARHLVVPASSDAPFRRALRELGYLLASGETRVTPT